VASFAVDPIIEMQHHSENVNVELVAISAKSLAGKMALKIAESILSRSKRGAHWAAKAVRI
jgi:hypothetical protein